MTDRVLIEIARTARAALASGDLAPLREAFESLDRDYYGEPPAYLRRDDPAPVPRFLFGEYLEVGAGEQRFVVWVCPTDDRFAVAVDTQGIFHPYHRPEPVDPFDPSADVLCYAGPSESGYLRFTAAIAACLADANPAKETE